ncbi:MAG: hypothetical protein EOP09_16825 [Proteobacteria bacterium]|nr:MAG: hypothetical protein EOP09_16825 [Pseudomonadota bacterium]
MSGTFSCTWEFFGDPAPGVFKYCYSASATAPTPTPTPTPTPAPTPAYPGALLGEERKSFTVPANTLVRFGANGKFFEKVVSGTFNCTWEFFGDPAPGVLKYCYSATAIKTTTKTTTQKR